MPSEMVHRNVSALHTYCRPVSTRFCRRGAILAAIVSTTGPRDGTNPLTDRSGEGSRMSQMACAVPSVSLLHAIDKEKLQIAASLRSKVVKDCFFIHDDSVS